MNSIPSTALRRTSAALNARRYAIAGVCLLVVAIALRFYDISEYALLYDEARAALNSRGTLSEVIDNTRHRNSSPILYPVALWAVQKAASTEFSVRLMPAAASALTIAALLFLMPRLGVPRRAAFLAALLATLSAPAIEHARLTREYSVDALIAALLIAGLLQYLRDGKRALLCAALFVAPLLQYGLILFGVAALGVAALAPSQTPVCDARQTYAAAIWGRLKRRIDLLLPMSAFAAACALSWALTARHQWTAGGWNSAGYLADYYYKSGFDAAAIAEFALNRTWGLLSYHMPSIIAAAALLAFGALLLSSLKRRRCDALALLCALALGVSLCAALMSLYPFGGLHQHLYLGPIIFLAAGGAFHSLADGAAAVARRAWLAPALATTAAIVITLVSAAAIRQGNSYYTANNIKAVIAALDEREREGDGVYVYRWAVPFMEFYKGEKPDNYFYEQMPCLDHTATSLDCVPEALDNMFRVLFNGSRRIWLIHNVNVPVQKEIAAYSQEITVEEIAIEETAAIGWNTLHLITDFEEVVASIRKEGRDMYDAVASEAPSAALPTTTSICKIMLYTTPSGPAPRADTEAKFFLHIYPTNAADLPTYGGALENLDFGFINYGFLTDDRCIIRRALPEYPIDRIHTGQFVYPDGAVVWEAELPFNP